MSDELNWMTAADLVRGYERGDFTPEEAAASVFERIGAVDGRLNAFRELDQDRAMAAARAAGQRWRNGSPLSPIDGVPVSIKDLFDVEGLSNRRGSKTSDAAPVKADAPVVARLKAAGAVITGKTNTPEFGWKGVQFLFLPLLPPLLLPLWLFLLLLQVQDYHLV